jgi:hypothetical protein
MKLLFLYIKLEGHNTLVTCNQRKARWGMLSIIYSLLIAVWRFTIENIRSLALYIKLKFVTCLLLGSTAPQVSYLYAYVSIVHHFINTLLGVFKKELLMSLQIFGEITIFLWCDIPNGSRTLSLERFHNHTKTYGSVIRLTHNTHNRDTSMLPPGCEPAIPASEQPHTHTLDCAVTGTSKGTTVQIANVVISISISISFLWIATRRNIAVVHRKLLWHLCAAGYLNSGMQAVSHTTESRIVTGESRATHLQGGVSDSHSTYEWNPMWNAVFDQMRGP